MLKISEKIKNTASLGIKTNKKKCKLIKETKIHADSKR